MLGIFLLLPFACGGLIVLMVRKRAASSRMPGWARLVLGNLLILGLLISAALLAGEIYFRFFYDSTDALGYTKVSQRWYQRHWHPNSSDCRDDLNYSLKLEPGKPRITFIGDSFTAGHGISEVSDRFANRIRQAHPEWQVHVLAQPGFDTGNELDYLEGSLKQGYQVDEVVLVYCLNDVADMFPEWAEKVGWIRGAAEKSNWLVRNSYCINTLYYRLSVRRNPAAESYFRYIKEGYGGEYWERQKARLKAFRDLVHAHGGRLSVVTFPFMHLVGPNYEYQFAHDELNQLWTDLKVPQLDLLPIYRDLPVKKITVSRYDSHPNEFANELAAHAIAEFLRTQMRAKIAQ